VWRNQKTKVQKSQNFPLSSLLGLLRKFWKNPNSLKVKKTQKEKNQKKTLYAQTSTPKVSKILKIKENFPNLLTKEIENIHKMINDSGKLKSRINITTKGPSRKQVIIPISNDNKSKFMASSSMHIANLNSILKNIKSEIMANFA